MEGEDVGNYEVDGKSTLCVATKADPRPTMFEGQLIVGTPFGSVPSSPDIGSGPRFLDPKEHRKQSLTGELTSASLQRLLGSVN